MIRTIIFVVILMFSSISIFSKSLAEYPEISTTEFTDLEDGDYIGECSTDLVSAKVLVKVVDGKINTIEILEHDSGLGKPAEKIVLDIVKMQSLDVDCISGATLSSTVIKKAIENAFVIETD